MTYTTSVGHAPVAGRLGIFSHLAQRFRFHLEARATTRALQVLSDEQLEDIGLTRYEIRQRARSAAMETLAGTTRAA